MPTKEELERLPLMWLAGVCKRISDADEASFPVAAREEAQKLWDEWCAIQVGGQERAEAGFFENRDIRVITLAHQHQMMTLGG